MKVAVAYCKGEIAADFETAKEFKVYEVSTGLVSTSSVVAIKGTPSDFLIDNKISTVICNKMGVETRRALVAKYVHVYYDVTGDADEAVRKWLGSLLEIKPGF